MVQNGHRRSSVYSGPNQNGWALVEAVDASEMEAIVEDVGEEGHLTVAPSAVPATYKEFNGAFTEVKQLWNKEFSGSKNRRVNLIQGQEYFLVSMRWLDRLYEGLVAYEKEDKQVADEMIARGEGGQNWSPKHDFLPEVDNADLVSRYTKWDVSLRPGLEHRKHFEVVLPGTWRTLMQFFGGGAEIVRLAVEDPTGKLMIDVSEVTLLFIASSDLTRYRECPFSLYANVGEVKRDMCKRFNLEPEDVRLWDFNGGKPCVCLDRHETLLIDAGLSERRLMLLEERKPDGSWEIDGPEATPANRRSVDIPEGGTYESASGGPITSSSSGVVSPPPRKKDDIVGRPGLTGLYNLRNTCYMNSTLQCLSNIPDLRDFFISGDFQKDLNPTNPLGTKGKLAKAYGVLMKQMWKSNNGRAISPKAFKLALEEFKPDFAGYMQHDSQELLSYLLDGLHEDLNRVKNKPYTEAVEAKGRPDHVVAKEALDVFKLRNDSLVSDLCTGMLLSKVTCPTCNNVSVKFDPYMILPLPMENGPAKTQNIQCHIIPFEHPFQKVVVEVEVPRTGPMLYLRNAVARASGMAQQEFFLVELSENKIIRIINDASNLDSLSADTKVYALENPDTGKHIAMLHGTFVDWHRPRLIQSGDSITVDESYLGFQETNRRGAPVSQPQDLSVLIPEQPFEFVSLRENDETGTTQIMLQPERSTSGAPKVSKQLPKLTCPYPCPFKKGQIWLGNFENSDDRHAIRIEVGHVVPHQDGYKILLILDINYPIPGSGNAVEQEVRIMYGDYFPDEVARLSTSKRPNSPANGATVNNTNAKANGKTVVENKRRSSSSRFSPRNVLSKTILNGWSSKKKSKDTTTSSSSIPQSMQPPQANGDAGPQEEKTDKELRKDPATQDRFGEVEMNSCDWKAVFNSTDEPTYLKRSKDFACKGVVDVSQEIFFGKVIFGGGFQGTGTLDFFTRLFYEPDEKQEESTEKVFQDQEKLNPIDRKLALNSSRAVRFVNRLASQPTSSTSIYYNTEYCLDPGVFIVDKDITEGKFLEQIVDHYTHLYNDAVQELQAKDVDLTGLPSFLDADSLQHQMEVIRAGKNYMVQTGGKDQVVGRILREDSDEVFFASRHSFLRVLINWDPSSPVVQLYERIRTNVDTAQKRDVLTVYESFDMFCKEEKLSEMDSWYCEKCKVHTEATKTLEIWSFPKVLILHLKRFSQEDMHYTHQKIEDPIDFPEHLDVRPYSHDPESSSKSVYNLCAVINHYGSLGSGHYTAFGRNEKDGKWYEFDDDAVTAVTAEVTKLAECFAYVLFYLRQDITPSDWKQK